MLRAVRRLVETHLVVVVVLRDEELEAIANARAGERGRRYPRHNGGRPAEGPPRRRSAASSISAFMSSKANMTRSANGWCKAISNSRKGTCCERAPASGRRAAPLVNATRFRAGARGRLGAARADRHRMEKRSIRSLSDEDLLALPALYRTTLSSLSVARDTSLDRALDHLSRAPVHARLFPDLRRPDACLAPADRLLHARLARGGAQPVARNLVLRRADLRRRASRLSPHPKRSELVLQHDPGRHGQGRDPSASARVPALDAL